VTVALDETVGEMLLLAVTLAETVAVKEMVVLSEKLAVTLAVTLADALSLADSVPLCCCDRRACAPGSRRFHSAAASSSPTFPLRRELIAIAESSGGTPFFLRHMNVRNG
jgi:hypothetical protein